MRLKITDKQRKVVDIKARYKVLQTDMHKNNTLPDCQESAYKC